MVFDMNKDGFDEWVNALSVNKNMVDIVIDKSKMNKHKTEIALRAIFDAGVNRGLAEALANINRSSISTN